jgi:alpha-L-rhamnosidase
MTTSARALGAILAVLPWVVAAAPPHAPEVTHLETQGAREPLGVDEPTPRLSWTLAATRRGVRQAAFRVLVASRPDAAAEGRADVWDSGRVANGDPWVAYAGPVLKAHTRYHWTVRVWEDAGVATSWAAPTWFETALPADEWRGVWIAGPERPSVATAEDGTRDDAAIRAAGEFCRPPAWPAKGFAVARNPNDQGECREVRPAPRFRKTFRVARPVARARLYASGLAYGDLALNGRAVSTSVLDPAFTDYSRTVLYTTHDVTALVQPGENVIAAELGSGRYDDATRTWDWGWDKAQWRATPRLRLDLRLTFADGAEEVVATGDSWRVSVDGPTRYDSLYLGETYDARREMPGWDRPGFDDSRWSPARVVDPPAGALRAEGHEPIQVVATREPGKRSEPAPGVVVYDVGQNLTGWVLLRVDAPAGTAVEAFYTEKLGQDGRGSTDGNNLVFGQLQTDDYVARGTGAERWTPRFTYKGFQYVQLSGPGGRPLPPGVSVTVERVEQVRTGVAAAGTFESANPTLDRIFRNTAWAVQNNLHGIITDTPVYEKNAWTGDAQLTAGTASFLFDTERLYRKMFGDMIDAQTAEGELSLLAPSNRNYGYVGKPFFKPVDCCGATPPWDAFWFVIPWESWLRHGDRAALVRTYPAMRKYLDLWVPRWTGKDGDAYAHTLTSGLGDWLPPEGVPTLNALVSTAYYAHLVEIARRTAAVLGHTEDAARYARLSADVRADFNARFLAPDGVYREKDADPFAQTAQVLPLAFGLVPEERRAAVVERLVNDIRGRRMAVGVIGARYILPVLTAVGQHDLAYALATETREPSWGYWTDVAGFTSLGESWPADTRSRNHHFFGAIVQWMVEDLAGVRPLAPGYAQVEFRPGVPDGLERASASHESVRGTVAGAWRRTAAGLDLEVTVPPSATGRVYVPAPGPQAVTEDGSGRALPAGRAPVVRLVGVEGDRVVYEVGSGTYRFHVARRAP